MWWKGGASGGSVAKRGPNPSALHDLEHQTFMVGFWTELRFLSLHFILPKIPRTLKASASASPFFRPSFGSLHDALHSAHFCFFLSLQNLRSRFEKVDSISSQPNSDFIKTSILRSMEGRVEMQANGAASSPGIPYVVPASDQLNQVRVGGRTQTTGMPQCDQTATTQTLPTVPAKSSSLCMRSLIAAFLFDTPV
jgi:hypothetical protein